MGAARSSAASTPDNRRPSTWASGGIVVKGRMAYLADKRGLVVGIANERSLACGIARAARTAGAELILTYQNERFAKRVHEIAGELRAKVAGACDLLVDDELLRLAGAVAQHGKLDFVLHAVAAAKREELEGRLLDTSRAGFDSALSASVYSLLALVRALEPHLAEGASILTLSYLGGERVVPHYNVMGVAKAALESAVRYLAYDLGPRGIRVNALSPGPVKTLSAAGVRGLRSMLSLAADNAPLRRNVTSSEVGDAAVFLLSPLARGITGEVVHVDAGYHVLGAPAWEGKNG